MVDVNEAYEEPNDFRNPSGTLVCGICGEPKETEPYANGIRFPILHAHQLQTLVSHKETDEQRAARIKRNRERCFAGEFYEEGQRDWFSAADFETDKDALTECEAFVRSFPESKRTKSGAGLLLFGHVGRGKTFLAGCVANALLDMGYSVLMTSTRRIRSMIERSYGSQNEVIERLCKLDLVILDDMFRDKDTEAGREIVFDVTDALYKMRVPIIVTTNASVESLKYPPEPMRPVVDRVKERCRRVEVTGPNRRQVKAA